MGRSYNVSKFKLYPWWKPGKSKRLDDYIQVLYTEKRADMFRVAEKLRKDGVQIKVNPKKWHAQVTYHEDQKNKHLKGYALFCKKSISSPIMVAHELIHITQFYFGYNVFPLCNTLIKDNHELIAHSHSFMMKRIIQFTNSLIN